MGHIPITHREYIQLNSIFDHESTSFYHHQFELAKEFRLTHNDNLPDTLFWEYLIYRHNIDPSRFDHYHKIVGYWIEHVPPPMPPVTPPPVVTTHNPPPGGGVSPTPEPSSMVLMAMAIITGFVFIVTVRYLTKVKVTDEI